jgi:hypothetical protein
MMTRRLVRVGARYRGSGERAKACLCGAFSLKACHHHRDKAKFG